ncbi:hypothetical protein KA005_57955, partial [bacterium]|nr:hypothetical protein [bacterium]
GRTPFQSAIKERLEQTDIKNSRVSVTTTSDHSFDPNNIEFNTEVLEKSENHLKLQGTTVIKFDNPLEAGNADNKWPKLQVTENPELIGEGTVIPGEYDQLIKDYILSQIQEIEDEDERAAVLAAWNEYDYESGSRKHIITEVYEITYPEEPQSVISYAAISSASTTTNDVLMGFTYEAPEINWVVEDKLIIEICVPILGCYDFTVYNYKAGVEFDAALGLRLPTEVTINHPNEMYETESYTLSTTIDGVDWNAAQYAAANVPQEDGNEFVARLKVWVGIYVEVAEITLIDWEAVDINRDYGKSFETPFGPDEEFPIPDLYLSPEDTGLKWGFSVANLGIGININPSIGSETINADWSASGDAWGSGTVSYHQPDVPYAFGPATADASGPTDYADIQLSDYEYHFDKCLFDVDAIVKMHLGWTGFEKNWDVPIDIVTIDASDLTGGLYLGVHSGTTADTAD